MTAAHSFVRCPLSAYCFPHGSRCWAPKCPGFPPSRCTRYPRACFPDRVNSRHKNPESPTLPFWWVKPKKKKADLSTLTSPLYPTPNPAANTDPPRPLLPPCGPVSARQHKRSCQKLRRMILSLSKSSRGLRLKLSRALCFSPAILTSTTCPPSSFVTAPALGVPVKGHTSGLLHLLFLPAEKLFSHVSAWHLPSHPSVFVQV